MQSYTQKNALSTVKHGFPQGLPGTLSTGQRNCRCFNIVLQVGCFNYLEKLTPQCDSVKDLKQEVINCLKQLG